MKIRLMLISVIMFAAIYSESNAIDVSKPALILHKGASLLNAAGNMQFSLPLSEYFDVRRGGGSFRGSRSSRSSRSTRSTRSSRSAKPKMTASQRAKTPSFGGTKMSKMQAQQKYGTPRRVSNMTGKNLDGSPVNYQMHSYGGFGSRMMTGYMMGSLGWMWFPSLLYTRPAYVPREDGTIGVYPPTFSWSKLFFMLIILTAIVIVIRAMIKSKRASRGGSQNYSSFT